MSTQRKTGRALLAGLFGAALALVAGAASAAEIYTCSMGGGRYAAYLTVDTDPVTQDRTCTRELAKPRTSAAAGTASCHSMARKVDCQLLN
jgi:hypothetical protein